MPARLFLFGGAPAGPRGPFRQPRHNWGAPLGFHLPRQWPPLQRPSAAEEKIRVVGASLSPRAAGSSPGTDCSSSGSRVNSSPEPTAPPSTRFRPPFLGARGQMQRKASHPPTPETRRRSSQGWAGRFEDHHFSAPVSGLAPARMPFPKLASLEDPARELGEAEKGLRREKSRERNARGLAGRREVCSSRLASFWTRCRKGWGPLGDPT